MSEALDHLDLHSADIAEQKRQELLRLFPEIRTEGGKIDFGRLQQALGEAVDGGKERYGINWPGKAECFKTIQLPSVGTLRPCPDESVNFAASENLILEGDNLEVLKLLQKSYLGKVKMIYIDPPYNTGNDFIYPDNYGENLQTYLQYTGQVDAEGHKFGTNTDTDGRFHSKWMNMMYPRLYLARNLLTEDGVIFISIDDHELENLRKLCNEIFGEENFVGNVIWQKKYSPQNDAKLLSELHEYVVGYARNASAWRPQLLARTEEGLSRYRNPDSDKRGPWKAGDLTSKTKASGHSYPITSPTGKIFSPTAGRQWAPSKSTYERLRKEDRIWFGSDGNNVPALKQFLSEVQDGTVPTTLWLRDLVGDNQDAVRELARLEITFDSPKPASLISHMLKICTQSDDKELILDFFAGSGTTAHAVLDLNQQDGGSRKFILVQLPEPTGRTDYPTIAEITKERVRRVIEKLNNEDAGKLDLDGAGSRDRGFRVYKLAESNFKAWNADAPRSAAALGRQLDLHIDHIREGRSAEDILYEILLKSGFPLTTPVETLTLADKTVYSVANGALCICLERALTLELIRALAAQKPERVVCLDTGFAGNDQLKANAVQIFKTQGVTSFKTV